MSRRSFLFLQGVCSPFNRRLAQKLSADGHHVVKVFFNGGDRVYWQRSIGPEYHFRGPLMDLTNFLVNIWQQHAITDQIIFGDRRPVHRAAIIRGPAAGVRSHVFEEGYFRPFWITLEREGVNGHSLLPNDPDWFREVHPSIPRLPQPVCFHSPFRVRAVHDVLYHLAGLCNPLCYPHYRNHSPVNAPSEYAHYLRRFSRLRFMKSADAQRMSALEEGRRPYFVLPLQLNSDAQIRDHSSFGSMQEVLDYVMASFAKHAPGDALLCIKNHPLDLGMVDYPRLIRRLERRYSLEGRTVYLESCDLNRLLKGAAGTITVNSTSGTVSLEHGVPTIALGDPIYRMAGQTFQGSLDDFWGNPIPPDPQLFKCFRDTIMYTTQLNGGFYCRPGIDLAVANAAHALRTENPPLEVLLQSTMDLSLERRIANRHEAARIS